MSSKQLPTISLTPPNHSPDGAIVYPKDFLNPELDWGRAYILCDFSPHVQLLSSVEEKRMGWARFIRAESLVPRDVILGIAFDANKFHAWAVVDDGKLLSSPTVNLPRAESSLESEDPASPEDLEAVLQFLDAMCVICLSDVYLTRGGFL